MLVVIILLKYNRLIQLVLPYAYFIIKKLLSIKGYRWSKLIIRCFYLFFINRLRLRIFLVFGHLSLLYFDRFGHFGHCDHCDRFDLLFSLQSVALSLCLCYLCYPYCLYCLYCLCCPCYLYDPFIYIISACDLFLNVGYDHLALYALLWFFFHLFDIPQFISLSLFHFCLYSYI